MTQTELGATEPGPGLTEPDAAGLTEPGLRPISTAVHAITARVLRMRGLTQEAAWVAAIIERVTK